jgi:tRNA-Thr(GGU) m(6)t(6)A37 methyltransferase TsaA
MIMKPPRPGEVAIAIPETGDAAVHFLGRIHTPWKTLAECPKTRDGRAAAESVIEVDEPYAQGLKDVALFSHLIVLYWLDEAPRGLIVQVPSHVGAPRGVFALRSPARPNPIGHAVVEIVRVEGNRIVVRGLDARDRTPLIDIKPYFATTDAFPEARRP